MPGAVPTQEPTRTRPSSPAQEPTQEPTSDPTPDPTQAPPVAVPAMATPDPNQVDMGVTAARSSLGPASLVTVDVTGLDPSQTGTVTVTSDQLSLSLTLDPRCTLLGVGTATCRLTGPSSLSMTTVTLLMPTTLTFTAAPQDGFTDPAMGDNTASVTVG